jgi:hypothetical protein
MPCHVLNCECPRFTGDSQVFLCPACSREYATRASLEIHLYGQHAGLSARERSVLLQGALNGRSPSIAVPLSRAAVRAQAEEAAET